MSSIDPRRALGGEGHAGAQGRSLRRAGVTSCIDTSTKELEKKKRQIPDHSAHGFERIRMLQATPTHINARHPIRRLARRRQGHCRGSRASSAGILARRAFDLPSARIRGGRPRSRTAALTPKVFGEATQVGSYANLATYRNRPPQHIYSVAPH